MKVNKIKSKMFIQVQNHPRLPREQNIAPAYEDAQAH